ncbi:MAG: acetyltransferase [Chitinophagaceae bacterium]|nr:acetyltransferase [Chitinophagaceae bacterium]
MRDLIIIGAGNVGGFLVYNQDLFEERFNLLGFLDDDVSKTGKEYYGLKVIGTTDDLYKMDKEVAVAIGIAFPKAKRKVFEKIKDNGNDFPAFVSKNAWLSKGVVVGRGVILYPGVSINYETMIEDFVIMNMNCAIGHNCYVSKFSALAPGVNLAGFTKVEEGVDLGIGVSTRQNIIVGKDAVIGGQSMLVKNVEPGAKIIGVPGMPFK